MYMYISIPIILYKITKKAIVYAETRIVYKMYLACTRVQSKTYVLYFLYGIFFIFYIWGRRRIYLLKYPTPYSTIFFV